MYRLLSVKWSVNRVHRERMVRLGGRYVEYLFNIYYSKIKQCHVSTIQYILRLFSLLVIS